MPVALAQVVDVADAVVAACPDWIVAKFDRYKLL
jgi:hypothetical protein